MRYTCQCCKKDSVAMRQAVRTLSPEEQNAAESMLAEHRLRAETMLQRILLRESMTPSESIVRKR